MDGYAGGGKIPCRTTDGFEHARTGRRCRLRQDFSQRSDDGPVNVGLNQIARFVWSATWIVNKYFAGMNDFG